MTSDVITKQEAQMLAALYRRERDAARQEADYQTHWAETRESLADAFLKSLESQSRENLRLRNELTAPTMGRIQNGLKKIEEMEAAQ